MSTEAANRAAHRLARAVLDEKDHEDAATKDLSTVGGIWRREAYRMRFVNGPVGKALNEYQDAIRALAAESSAVRGQRSFRVMGEQ